MTTFHEKTQRGWLKSIQRESRSFLMLPYSTACRFIITKPRHWYMVGMNNVPQTRDAVYISMHVELQFLYFWMTFLQILPATTTNHLQTRNIKVFYSDGPSRFADNHTLTGLGSPKNNCRTGKITHTFIHTQRHLITIEYCVPSNNSRTSLNSNNSRTT